MAFRVFELGIKRFGSDAGYLLAYLDHISHLNGEGGRKEGGEREREISWLYSRAEDNNTRVLFEKALSSVSPDNTRSE